MKALALSKRPGWGEAGDVKGKETVILLNIETGITLVLRYMQRLTSGKESVKNYGGGNGHFLLLLSR